MRPLFGLAAKCYERRHPMFRLTNFDVEFVRRWSPIRFMLVGIAGYVVLFALSPLEYAYEYLSLEAFGYFVLVVGSFLAGAFIGQVMNRQAGPLVPQPIYTSADAMINTTAILGLVGVLARIYDRFILRGFQISSNIIDARESIAEGITVFAYVGGLFFCFGMVSLVLIWLSDSQRRRPAMFAFVVMLALYPTFEAMLAGGRSTLLHTAFLIFIFGRSTDSLQWLFRSPLKMALAALLVLGALVAIYEFRSLQGVDDLDLVDVFKQTAISKFAYPPAWIVDILIDNAGEGLVAELLKGWVHLSQYFTHSWLAYCASFDQSVGVFGMGRIHFIMPTRLLSGLLGEDWTYDPGLYGMETGLSSTTVSLIYYDFGLAGPAIAVVFGYVVSWVHRKAILYPERWLPLHAYLCLNCLTVMIDNQLVGGMGTFAIWAFIAYVPLHWSVTSLMRGTDSPLANRAGDIDAPLENAD